MFILVLDIRPRIRRFLRRGNRNKLLPQQGVNKCNQWQVR